MNSQQSDQYASSRALRSHGRRSGCVTRLVAVILFLSSIGLGIWNLWEFTPWEDAVSRQVTAASSQSPHARVNPYSVNTFLSQEVEPWKRERTVEMIADAGIGWIKEGIPWSEIEPADGSYWNAEFQQNSWAKFDRIIDLAEAHGLRVIARLDHPPEWATGVETDYQAPPTDVGDYGDFVEAFVERYSGRVQHIQVWNEPNLSREWGGEIDPEGYFELLREAYTRAKKADPGVVVLSAPMAMTNERSERAIPEFDYWEALYEHGAGDYFDVLTATGYGIDQPPEDSPSRQEINLRRIELLRNVVDDHGDVHKPIWLTEYGWNASPSSVPRDRLDWGSVTDQQQAGWTARGIEWMDQNWDWFGVASIWYFRQVGVIPPDEPEYYFAMVDLEFTPRLVYLSVREEARDRQIALPGEYGPLESPVQQTGAWPRFDDGDAPFGQSIVGSTEGTQLRISFSGTDLHVFTSDDRPLHGRLFVELNGEPVPGETYEATEEGRTFLDLDESFSPGGTISLVEDYGANKPQQVNELVLTLGRSTSFSVSEIEVDYHRSYAQFSLLTAVAVLGATGALLLLRR